VAGPLRLGQVSAESDASQQGQPEENDMDRSRPRRPAQASNVTCLPRGVVAS
jgi:hypothetical protein